MTEIRPGSLLSSFNRILLLLYLGSVVVTIPAVYWITRHQTMQAAQTQLNLLVEMVAAVRKYVADDVRPVLLAKEIFHAPAVSSTVAMSRVATNFLGTQPDYYIKTASDNPLNSANNPEPFERDLLEGFRSDAKLGAIVKVGRISGHEYLVSARPSRSKAECQQCHGAPSNAPAEIRAQYDSGLSGYFYKDGEVVGVNVVGVPLGNVNALAMERSLAVVGLLTGLFGVLMFTIQFSVRRNIIRPLVEITSSAQAVSQGDMGRRIETKRNDEIGELARAFELMRRSLQSMMRRASQ